MRENFGPRWRAIVLAKTEYLLHRQQQRQRGGNEEDVVNPRVNPNRRNVWPDQPAIDPVGRARGDADRIKHQGGVLHNA
jgi:hypothetical protein